MITQTKTKSFFTRGLNTKEFLSLKEFLEDQGMYYGIEKTPVYVSQNDSFEKVNNQFELRRKNDNKIVSTHSISAQYGEISPIDLCEELEPFCLEGWAIPEAAFTISQNEVENTEIVCLRLNDDNIQTEIKVGDIFQWYLVAKNYHGKGSAFAGVFGERKICGNGMTAICSESEFRISHRGRAADKYKEAIKRWEGLKIAIQKLAKRLNLYMEIPLAYNQMESLTNQLLGVSPEEKISTRTKNLRLAFLDAFNLPTQGTYGKTVADFYNAVTYVGSHWTASKSKLTQDDINDSLLEGTRGKRETKALAIIDKFISSI